MITHIIKTKSIKSDGRLLKWIRSLNESGFHSEVLALEDNNIKQSFNTEAEKVTTLKLQSRVVFGKRKGYLFKVPEFTYKTIRHLSKSTSNVFIFHDVQHYLTLILIIVFNLFPRRTIVWDLHELPHSFLSRYFISKRWIRKILMNVNVVIYTNNDRKDCIENMFQIKPNKTAVLNNYPDSNFIRAGKSSIPTDLEKWLDGEKYLLWMGAANSNRNFIPVLEAFDQFKDRLKLVVVGTIDDEVKNLIIERNLESSIFSTFVAQEEIINFVDNALFSIVFYKDTSLNNRYCEPNRLYQLVTRKVPVIVGNNPPLKNIVERFQAGIVLKDDGTDSSQIASAINEMLCRTDEFKSNLEVPIFEDSMNWNNQFGSILPLLKL